MQRSSNVIRVSSNCRNAQRSRLTLATVFSIVYPGCHGGPVELYGN
jgi:hypothetical protein